MTHASADVHLGGLELVDYPVDVVETDSSAQQSVNAVDGDQLLQYFHVFLELANSSLSQHPSDVVLLQCFVGRKEVGLVGCFVEGHIYLAQRHLVCQHFQETLVYSFLLSDCSDHDSPASHFNQQSRLFHQQFALILAEHKALVMMAHHNHSRYARSLKTLPDKCLGRCDSADLQG